MSVGNDIQTCLQSEAVVNGSVEFCGGTHVSNTKDIELFVITSEGSLYFRFSLLYLSDFLSLPFLNFVEELMSPIQKILNYSLLLVRVLHFRFSHLSLFLPLFLSSLPEFCSGTHSSFHISPIFYLKAFIFCLFVFFHLPCLNLF